MEAQNLQSWLLNEHLVPELQSLAVASARLEFNNLVTEPSETTFDWPKLLLAGSILARGSSREMQEAALRIATAAITTETNESVKEAGAILLSKLANHRSVELALQRNLISAAPETSLGIMSLMEQTFRRTAHSVLETATGTWLRANTFQEEFWTEASTPNSWISASAPTASGKSFLLRHWLIEQLRSTKAKVAIYIAPTRALVTEIEDGLRQLTTVGQTPAISVVSLPLKELYLKAFEQETKAVFVLTQERLHLLANQVGTRLHVDILIVDEAHKIGDRTRGVILQDAIERVSRSNPTLRAVFVSPATQNPEILLSGAPNNVRRVPVNSDSPTVIQNLILASQLPLSTTTWSLTLRLGETELLLGYVNLPARPTTVGKRLALVAAAVGTRGGTLVYANGAAEAENIALLISQLIPANGGAPNPELTSLAELARDGVHPKYQLASLVEKGVAFHYGNMPTLLRLEIERLFREGHLRYLVCTSTLVEGVNLSCRNIVVRGPQKGRGNTMPAPDFWNLAGRAGRWGNEFQGNIVCVDADQPRVWPQGVPERSRFPIVRETDAAFENLEALEHFVENRSRLSAVELLKQGRYETVSAYLMSVFLRNGTINELPFPDENSASLVRLEGSLAKAAASIELPLDLLSRHTAVSPVGLQRLLMAFRVEDSQIDLAPPRPEDDAAYRRFCKMMALVNACIYPAFWPAARIPLYALVVIEWLRGFSLTRIIARRIEYQKRHGQTEKLATTIRSTMEIVEQTARFLAPKYFSAYVDVLRFHWQGTEYADLLTGDIDIGLALEFGASTRTLLSLIELGLSRMTAVSLSEKMIRDDLSKEECVAWVQERVEAIEGFDFPVLMLKEIQTRILGHRSSTPWEEQSR